MTSSWSVLNTLGVLRVSQYCNTMIFNFLSQMIYRFGSNRSNSKGNSETNGYWRIDHLPCEKPFAGMMLCSLYHVGEDMKIFLLKSYYQTLFPYGFLTEISNRKVHARLCSRYNLHKYILIIYASAKTKSSYPFLVAGKSEKSNDLTQIGVKT